MRRSAKRYRKFEKYGDCKRCMRWRKIQSRGLCHSDYNMWNRKQHLIKCRECPQQVHRHGRYILCKSCSMKGNRNPAAMSKYRRLRTELFEMLGVDEKKSLQIIKDMRKLKRPLYGR
jgi:hypothetical protein